MARRGDNWGTLFEAAMKAAGGYFDGDATGGPSEGSNGSAAASESRERGRELIERFVETLESVDALIGVLEDIGEEVIEAGDDPDDQIEAGIKALAPRDDDDQYDDQAIRAAVRWFVLICSGTDDLEPEPERPPRDRHRERPKRKKKR